MKVSIVHQCLLNNKVQCGTYEPKDKTIEINAEIATFLKIATLLHKFFHYCTDILIKNTDIWEEINNFWDRIDKILPW